MKTTHHILLSAVLILVAAIASPLSAQGDPNTLLIDLDVLVPIKSPVRESQVPIRHQVNWEKVADQIGELLSSAEGTSAEAMALFHMGNALFHAGRIEEAQLTFQDLRDRHGNHPLVKVSVGEDKKSLVAKSLDDCAKELAFRLNHKVKSLPKPVVDKSVTATLHFSEGDVNILFYKNVAQEHRKNFIKLAKEGYYDRICVHRINPDSDIQLGCPNTRERNIQLWGQGGPGYDLPHEFSRLFHKRGILTATSAPRSGKSHGSQFNILLREQPTLDFVQTPFAIVADDESLGIVHKISVAQRNQNSAPLKKVYLNGISIKAADKD